MMHAVAVDHMHVTHLGPAHRHVYCVQLVKSLITGYVSQPNEYEYWMPDSCIGGEIPQDLDGTLFRNGEHLHSSRFHLHREFCSHRNLTAMPYHAATVTMIKSMSRAGPGLIDVFGKRLNQPFDGDGMICQFAFRDGKLHFR